MRPLFILLSPWANPEKISTISQKWHLLSDKSSRHSSLANSSTQNKSVVNVDNPTFSLSDFQVYPKNTKFPTGLLDYLNNNYDGNGGGINDIHNCHTMLYHKCYIIKVDLNHDGQNEWLIIGTPDEPIAPSPYSKLIVNVLGIIVTQDGSKWQFKDNVTFSKTVDQKQLAQILAKGQYKIVPPIYNDLMFGDNRLKSW